MTGLEQACRELRPWATAAVALVNEPPDDILTGFIGSYGKIRGATAYLVFIGDETDPHAPAKVGYTGEALILEATSLGIGTCWVSGTFRRGAAMERVQLGPTERVFAVSPLGYAHEKPTAQERLVAGFAQSHKRKPLEAMCAFAPTEQWQRTALEAARLAPSAMNGQPWLFSLEDGDVVVSAKRGIAGTAKLDCGIAMLHFELGAKKEEVKGRWEFGSAGKVGRFVRE